MQNQTTPNASAATTAHHSKPDAQMIRQAIKNMDMRVVVVAQQLSDGSHAHAVQIIDNQGDWPNIMTELDALSEGHAEALKEALTDAIRRHTNIRL